MPDLRPALHPFIILKAKRGGGPERAEMLVFHMQTVISQSGLQSGLSDVFYVTLANSLVKRVGSG